MSREAVPCAPSPGPARHWELLRGGPKTCAQLGVTAPSPFSNTGDLTALWYRVSLFKTCFLGRSAAMEELVGDPQLFVARHFSSHRMREALPRMQRTHLPSRPSRRSAPPSRSCSLPAMSACALTPPTGTAVSTQRGSRGAAVRAPSHSGTFPWDSGDLLPPAEELWALVGPSQLLPQNFPVLALSLGDLLDSASSWTGWETHVDKQPAPCP